MQCIQLATDRRELTKPSSSSSQGGITRPLTEAVMSGPLTTATSVSGRVNKILVLKMGHGVPKPQLSVSNLPHFTGSFQ